MLQSGFFPEASKESDDGGYALRTLLRARYFFMRQATAAKNYLQGVTTTRGLHCHEYPGQHPLKKPGRLRIKQGHGIISQALLAHVDADTQRILTFEGGCGLCKRFSSRTFGLKRCST